MESLYDFFVRENPTFHTNDHRVAIEAFEALLPDKAWRPSNPKYGGFLPIIEIGIAAHFLKEVPSAQARLIGSIDYVMAGVRPPAAELAEVNCGALVSCLGLSIDYPRGRNGRSPDLVVVDQNAVIADIEVVCAQQRRIHVDELVTQQNLSEAIGIRMDAHVAIFVADELSGDLVDEVVNGVIHVPIGGAIEKEGKWCVVARALPDRKPFEGGSRHEITPSWWPVAGAETFVQTVRLGPGSPILAVVCKTLEASYLNPIRRKAERPQRTGNLPYVIAVDVAALPDAFKEIPKELAGFWGQWKHVSAVLLFLSYQGVGLNGWWCSIARNPFASIVLPQDMLPNLDEHRTEVIVISRTGTGA